MTIKLREPIMFSAVDTSRSTGYGEADALTVLVMAESPTFTLGDPVPDYAPLRRWIEDNLRDRDMAHVLRFPFSSLALAHYLVDVARALDVPHEAISVSVNGGTVYTISTEQS